MTKIRKITNTEVMTLARNCVSANDLSVLARAEPVKLYGVPRGGIPAAYAIASILHAKGAEEVCTVNSPEDANIIVDDLIDSGKTKEHYTKLYPEKLFITLMDKRLARDNAWIVFPWEETEEISIEDNIVRLLQYVGEDVTRGGLQETPARAAKAWKAWTAGYDQKPEDVLKVFKDGAKAYDEMVVVKDIPFYSHCEHHLAPFFGTATIAYIPNGSIVGLSKLSRLLDVFAKRLQVQERLTNQVADSITEHLNALGCGVIIKARHLCMESRGVCKQGHHTITCAVRGVMKEKPEARAEFMALAG